MISTYWKKYFLKTLGILTGAYLFSFIGYYFPFFGKVFFILIIFTTIYFAYKNLTDGLLIVLGELFIGSQGHLFSITIANFELSLRIALFIIIFLIFGWQVFRKKITLNFTNRFYAKILIIFLAFIAWSFFIGLVKNNGLTNIYADGNAFLFLFYLIIFAPFINNEKIIIKIFLTLGAALLTVTFLTLIYFIIFAYQPFNLSLMYKWIRDTRLGEITFVNGNIYRIFLQAQIYCLIGLFISYIFLVKKNLFITTSGIDKQANKFFLILAFSSSLTTILSFSRSNWVGVFLAFGFFLILCLFIIKTKIKQFFKILIYFVIINIISVAFLYLISGNFSPALIKSRVSNLTEDSAGISRLNQLRPLWQNIKNNFFLGAGFGKTVTYQTNDPRVLKKAPSGLYTTYAFEWGYLDLLLKFGFFGFLAYLLLIFTIIKKGVSLIKTHLTENQKLLILGTVTGLSGVCLTNIFSPYLNHPLGLGFLIITALIIDYYVQIQKSEIND